MNKLFKILILILVSEILIGYFIYLNNTSKITGHYIREPNTFKPRAGKRLKLNKYISLTEGIVSILKEKNF